MPALDVCQLQFACRPNRVHGAVTIQLLLPSPLADAQYSGSMLRAEAFGPKTGVQFASEPTVVRQAIALLKKRNPRTKVGL